MVDWRNYTNRELRFVLYGLGYGVPVNNDSPTDAIAQQGIRAFQHDRNLVVDGIVGDKTQAEMAAIVSSLHNHLNIVVRPNPPLPGNQFYGPKTTAAVKDFQKRYDLPITGVADTYVRDKLEDTAYWWENRPQPDPVKPIYLPKDFAETIKGLGYANISSFQRDYDIPQTGTANPETQEILAKIVRNLQHNLNLIFQPRPLIPYSEIYDHRTEEYVGKFQQQLGLPITKTADLSLRKRLDRWARNKWLLGSVSY
ncbi:MAG: peptidoglycan-binding protein [Limnospira sp. PMC 1279.21]|uniref:Peptidoglycan-binding protein n=1 Tax=Limnospira fusiformis PMC 851.14 TaxID=2219512 RepID=A0ABU9ELR8_LIMFS|nr:MULTISPECIES: peptidoglycan-binding protein [Limnospira]EKD10681.1 peptidoglycan-binding domain 1 protein [Arthrospira platensis C1]MDY7053609.1 peptidoglycan-binding protein [Limnospira fusiformis LS22]RAQ47824.1 peptidoglycan-binding protein [Arthrospira sp. O9.13F]MDT9186591.1 peptidoglycan-binding protein [Limnospira sp. PMC 894.15]MDT9207313.1 peptidoglycan-binding protein [Limnospira sp. PMC 1252.20]